MNKILIKINGELKELNSTEYRKLLRTEEKFELRGVVHRNISNKLNHNQIRMLNHAVDMEAFTLANKNSTDVVYAFRKNVLPRLK